MKKAYQSKISWTRIVLTWVVLLVIAIVGAYSFWLRINEPWIQNPNAPASHKIYIILLSFAPFPAGMILFLTPVWVSKSCLVIKRAIDSAYKNDYKTVRSILFAHQWMIFPQAKYADIVYILRDLCEDRKQKPEGVSSKFLKYIVLGDNGEYVLSLEGKEKMTQTVDAGWLNAKKAEDISSPRTIKMLMGLVVVVAVVRGIVLIIHIFMHH